MQVMLPKRNFSLSPSASFCLSELHPEGCLHACEYVCVIAGPLRTCLTERLRTMTLRRWRGGKTDKERGTHRGGNEGG